MLVSSPVPEDSSKGSQPVRRHVAEQPAALGLVLTKLRVDGLLLRQTLNIRSDRLEEKLVPEELQRTSGWEVRSGPLGSEEPSREQGGGLIFYPAAL